MASPLEKYLTGGLGGYMQAGRTTREEEERVQREIGNYLSRLQHIHQTPPEQEKEIGALYKFLDVIDRPRNALVTAMGSSGDFWGGLKRGWKGEEHTFVSDLLERKGMDDKVERAVLGFIGDVALDPTIWLGGMGAGKAAMRGVRGVSEGAVKAGLAHQGVRGAAAPTGLLERLGHIAGSTPLPGKSNLGSAMVEVSDKIAPLFSNRYISLKHQGNKREAFKEASRIINDMPQKDTYKQGKVLELVKESPLLDLEPSMMAEVSELIEAPIEHAYAIIKDMEGPYRQAVRFKDGRPSSFRLVNVPDDVTKVTGLIRGAFGSGGQVARDKINKRITELMTDIKAHKGDMTTEIRMKQEELTNYIAARDAVETSYARQAQDIKALAGGNAELEAKLQNALDWHKMRNEQLAIQDGIPTTERIPDYIYHLYEDDPAKVRQVFKKKSDIRRVAGTTIKAEKERRVLVQDWGEKMGLTPIRDAWTQQVVRELDSARKQARIETIRELMDIDGIGQLVKKGTQVSRADAIQHGTFRSLPGIPELEGYVVHKDIHKLFERLDNILFSDAHLTDVFRHFDAVQNLWKGSVTAIRPAWHVQNMFGNAFNNYLAGMYNPKYYYLAADMQKGGNIDAFAKQFGMTTDEIMDSFQRFGLGGFGDMMGEARRTAKEWGLEARGIKKMTPMAVGRRAGGAVETNSKLAHFIWRLAKGDDVETAAQSVNRFLFDYTDLTRVERQVFRRFVPFYTFTRKNLPLQLETLITDPQRYLGVKHLQDNLLAVQGMELTDVPEYMHERAFPVTEDKMFVPSLPTQTLGDVTEANMLLGFISPLMRAPVELATNHSWFFNRPLEKYEGEQGKFMGMDMPAKLAYILNQIGGVRDISGMATKATTEGDDRPKPMSTMYSDSTDALERVFGELMQPVMRDYDKQASKLHDDYAYRRQLEDYIRLLKDSGIDVPTITEIEKAKKRGRLL